MKQFIKTYSDLKDIPYYSNIIDIFLNIKNKENMQNIEAKIAKLAKDKKSDILLLTTMDNPFHPSKQYSLWNDYDGDNKSNNFLARVSDEYSSIFKNVKNKYKIDDDILDNIQNDLAVIEILYFNNLNKYAAVIE